MLKTIWNGFTFLSDILAFAFVIAVLSGVLQIVKGPYWGNFVALFH